MKKGVSMRAKAKTLIEKTYRNLRNGNLANWGGTDPENSKLESILVEFFKKDLTKGFLGGC